MLINCPCACADGRDKQPPDGPVLQRLLTVLTLSTRSGLFPAERVLFLRLRPASGGQMWVLGSKTHFEALHP